MHRDPASLIREVHSPSLPPALTDLAYFLQQLRGGQTLEEVGLRSGTISILGGIQNPTGNGAGQPALDVPVLAEGWSR